MTLRNFRQCNLRRFLSAHRHLSQNHRTIGAGKDFQRTSNPAPCKAGELQTQHLKHLVKRKAPSPSPTQKGARCAPLRRPPHRTQRGTLRAAAPRAQPCRQALAPPPPEARLSLTASTQSRAPAPRLLTAPRREAARRARRAARGERWRQQVSAGGRHYGSAGRGPIT